MSEQVIVKLRSDTVERHGIRFNAVGGRGLQGPTGPQGDPGGATGPQGTTGPTGPQGNTGSTGPQGSGLNIIGTLATVGDLPGSGSQGDAYLIDGDLYVWNGSSWTNVGQVQGPQGFTGVAGPTGTAGTNGFTGPQGVTGVQGATGVQGPTGVTGFTGPQGTTGLTGFTGPQGATGPQGPTGDGAPLVNSTTSTSTLTINSATTNIYRLTAQAAALTIAAPTGSPVDGQRLIIAIKDNGTARAITWNAIFVAFNVALPTTTVTSKWVYIGFLYDFADTKWHAVSVSGEV